MTSQLTLSGGPTDIWVFKAESDLTPKNGSVVMAGGGNPCNVYWWTAQSATMTDSRFVGTILAGTAVAMTRGTFNGKALAKVAVTVTGTAITGTNCGGVVAPPSLATITVTP